MLLGFVPRNEIAGSDGNSMFKLERNCQTVFQSSCNTPSSSVRELQFLHHPHQHLFTFYFSHPADMKWNLTVVLSSISLMTDHVEHLLCIYHFKTQQLSLQHATNTNNPSSMRVILRLLRNTGIKPPTQDLVHSSVSMKENSIRQLWAELGGSQSPEKSTGQKKESRLG